MKVVSEHSKIQLFYVGPHGRDLPVSPLGQVYPLRRVNAQYHQNTCAVKSHSRALATFRNMGQAQKQVDAI